MGDLGLGTTKIHVEHETIYFCRTEKSAQRIIIIPHCKETEVNLGGTTTSQIGGKFIIKIMSLDINPLISQSILI